MTTKEEKALLCDVGGTNVRFGIQTENDETPVFDKKYKCNEFSSFVEAVKHYFISRFGENYADKKEELPSVCVIGAAGNIDEKTGEVTSTNTPWKVKSEEIRQAFPFLKSICVENDFKLQGWALFLLKPEQYRSVFQQKDEKVDFTTESVVIIGPGTGLGTCLIMKDTTLQILTSEAGHNTLPSVRFNTKKENEENEALVSIIRKHYAQRRSATISEHFISGTGITNIYHAFKDGKIPLDKSKRVPSEQIEELAKKGDKTALKTFKYFNAYLGAHAGTLAATTKTQRIFFCGGLMVSEWVISQLENSPEFKQQLEARAGMTESMKSIRFFASKERDMAALGAFSHAKDIIARNKCEQAQHKANRDLLGTLAILQALIEEEANNPQIKKQFMLLSKKVQAYKAAQAQAQATHGTITFNSNKKTHFQNTNKNKYRNNRSGGHGRAD